MSARSKIITAVDETKLFWFLVSAIVLVATFYVYAVNRTVILVAERNSMESKISAERTAITYLESNYLAENGKITIDLAQSLGYGEATNVVYMPMKAVSVLTRANTIQ